MIEIIPNWHPIFVHFTLALWTVATGFFLLSIVWKENRWRVQWLHVARWNMWVGAIFALATGVAGWLAYNSVAHDTPSHAAMTEHRNWALATLAVMLPLSVWSVWCYRYARDLGRGFLLLLVIGVSLLGATAWHGGELVYRYGLGVMSLPAVEGEGHHHVHEDDQMHGHESMAESPHVPTASSGKIHVHEDGSAHKH